MEALRERFLAVQLFRRRVEMLMLLHLLSMGLGIASFVCLILVLVNIFQAGKTGLGILCLLTIFVCGIGALITFIVGWVNVDEFGIRKLMLNWTLCIVLNIIISVIVFIVGGAQSLTVFHASSAGFLM
jgi:hypothetical protein